MSKLVSLGLLCIGFLSPGACFAGINDDVLAVVRKLLAEGQPWVQVTHRLHRVTFYSACGNSVASANLPDSERPDPILELLVSKNPFGREGRELSSQRRHRSQSDDALSGDFLKKRAQVEVLRPVFVDYKVDELEKRSAYSIGIRQSPRRFRARLSAQPRRGFPCRDC